AALPLAAAGGGAAAVWLRRRQLGRPATATVLLLLAVLVAAGVWETAHRRLLRRDLVERELPLLAPPSGAELALLGERVETFFGDSDLGRFVPRSPEDLERQDLAFVLWESSPLARLDAASALVVRPLDGPPSSFAFGLLLSEEGEPIWDPLSWRGQPPRSEDALTGEAVLSYRGRRWARLEWMLVPLPGFDLAGRGRVAEVEAALLRGGPAKTTEGRLPEGVKLAFYDDAGRPVDSPWQEAPPLPASLAAGNGVRRAVVATPEGAAWAAVLPLPATSGARRRAVLYLPVLSPLAGLERAGTGALGLVLAVLLVTVLALLLALPRAAFRDLLRRTVRSYSKRLLLVYTLLLVIPLLLLNVVLVAAMEDRLRDEQQATGEAALAAAQRMLGSYLASLEPGFDLATGLDDVLLVGLSLVVRHEINLYWGSEIWASTKPELFAARLLPRRIPGESFERIALKGYDLAARTNRVGETSYLELYAPLQVPGEEVGPRNFFLSMPLLAQQEEVARELGALRRQALLITAALVVLVTAVGTRLSRGFTRPLTELVEGTRRIARGARSLDLAPTELELAALVEAVDDMARRIAEARERLVREKQVVEGVVEHINSGVVSLDHHGRVLLRNRVAADLLGVRVDEPLAAALARDPRLDPVGDWLEALAAGRPGEPAQRTVRLAAPGDGGSSGEDAAAGGEREWSLVWVPVPGPGDPAALLVVEDVTETLRGQRLEAWAEMARIIAHEIKNPLTPIRLNVEHMQQVWRDGLRQREGRPAGPGDADRFDEIFARCTRNVLVQVEELRQIAAEFSTYSRIPRIERQPGDLVAAMRELVEPYRAAPPAGVTVELEAPEDPLPARFDRRLLARAVRNLLENALRASAGGGRVTLRLEHRPGVAEADRPSGGGAAEARIVVLDAGPGVEPALLPRIFDPYFSTHDTGTGLGLPIARRIVEEHGGSIVARNHPAGGMEVAIVLPAEAAER
ncbi:MAG TPA: ATP-binding protein, partial [Thermoanaerobaculia bacterium]|nr:ATP-binding protein [Thermoanaerobaculia bacterium]